MDRKLMFGARNDIVNKLMFGFFNMLVRCFQPLRWRQVDRVTPSGRSRTV